VGRVHRVRRGRHRAVPRRHRAAHHADRRAEPVRDRARRRCHQCPRTLSAITDGRPQISGNFTEESALTLADQLKFGALPIGFEIQSSENISATLGVSQLQSGIIAGIIGLILVGLYSFLQYRALGGVVLASLVVSAIITYLIITYLSNQQASASRSRASPVW